MLFVPCPLMPLCLLKYAWSLANLQLWELGARDGICVSSLVPRLPFSVRQACNVSLPLHQALPEDPDHLVFVRPWAHVVSGNLAVLREGEVCDVLSVFVGSAWHPPRVEPLSGSGPLHREAIMEKVPQGGADDCPPAALGHRAIRFYRTSGPASKHAGPAQPRGGGPRGQPQAFPETGHLSSCS